MIGGEIEIAEPQALGPDLPSLGEALGLLDDRTAWFGTAREAVRWWIDHLKPPGAMLVPAYCCEAVVQPYREAGVEVRFFPVGRDLRIDPATLEPLLPGAGAIHAIHYFGFPAPRALFELGVPVLEDAVQALLSPWAYSHGQWAIASLRKFLPVPDGALLAARKGFTATGLLEARGGVYARKLEARRAKQAAVDRKDAAAWWAACRELEQTEHELDGPIEVRAMSTFSRQSTRGLNLSDLAARRRTNYETLQDLLGTLPSRVRPVHPLFAYLPADVVPYGFPVLTEQRDDLKEHLASQGIYTVIHWDLPKDLTPATFPESWWLYDRILTLPIDHRYGPSEMATIAAAVQAFGNAT